MIDVWRLHGADYPAVQVAGTPRVTLRGKKPSLFLLEKEGMISIFSIYFPTVVTVGSRRLPCASRE